MFSQIEVAVKAELEVNRSYLEVTRVNRFPLSVELSTFLDSAQRAGHGHADPAPEPNQELSQKLPGLPSTGRPGMWHSLFVYRPALFLGLLIAAGLLSQNQRQSGMSSSKASSFPWSRATRSYIRDFSAHSCQDRTRRRKGQLPLRGQCGIAPVRDTQQSGAWPLRPRKRCGSLWSDEDC